MFDDTSARYDLMNDLLTGGVDRLWRIETVRAINPKAGEYILDLAAGTGTSSAPLAARKARVFPTDISSGMLARGRRRHPEFRFVAGDALALPYCDQAFDVVTISFGLRNVENTLAALQEMRRVTRPGGRLVICEFATPTWSVFANVYRWYLGHVMKSLSRFSSNPASYQYLAESILAWPKQEAVSDLIAQAGWSQVEHHNLSGGIVALHRAVNP